MGRSKEGESDFIRVTKIILYIFLCERQMTEWAVWPNGKALDYDFDMQSRDSVRNTTCTYYFKTDAL